MPQSHRQEPDLVASIFHICLLLAGLFLLAALVYPIFRPIRDGWPHATWLAATLTLINLWTRDNAPFTRPDSLNAQAILARAAQE